MLLRQRIGDRAQARGQEVVAAAVHPLQLRAPELGMQLRLVVGPLHDAGAAARICAVLTENNRPCETAIFEGQRLALKADDVPSAAAKPAPRRRAVAKRAAAVVEEVAKKPEPPPASAPQTTLSTFFNRRTTQ